IASRARALQPDEDIAVHSSGVAQARTGARTAVVLPAALERPGARRLRELRKLPVRRSHLPQRTFGQKSFWTLARCPPACLAGGPVFQEPFSCGTRSIGIVPPAAQWRGAPCFECAVRDSPRAC